MATRPPARTSKPKPPVRRGTRLRLLLARPRKQWIKWVLLGVGVPGLILFLVGVYFWISYGRLIDAKLGGEQQPIPRIFGRPFEIRPGRGLAPAQLVQRLNDVGYAEREKPARPGEFSVGPNFVLVAPRTADADRVRVVRVDFSKSTTSPVVSKLTEVGGKAVDRVTLEAPMLAALAPGQKRRYIPLAAIPKTVVNAILAIEDRRFYDHPGVDPIRAVGAIITNLRGDKQYLVGGSTLTQQIVKNTFLTPEKTLRRKVQEQFMAVVLESRFTKDQILELYLNDVVLGQRGPFEIHGVAEAARIFFGKDVSNLTIGEAATMAGLIQSPSRLSPFRNPERAQERRNIVLREMAEAGFITKDEAVKAANEPLKIMTRALENEAPYFVDYVNQLVDEKYAGLLKPGAAVDVYTTLDLHLQRMAQEAVAEGAIQLDKQLAKRKLQPQIALIAVDPRTGEILAMVGGRAYSQSQYNRAVTIRRQPGSVFKPFVYLAAFDRMAEEHSAEITPATVFADEPTVFKDGDNDYSPSNYQNEYDGPITVRRALALSRNIVTIKVAEAIGYDKVVATWKKVGVGTPAKPYPSIALGVFEASPLEIATAYTVFTNSGMVRPLQAVSRIIAGSKPLKLAEVPARPVARPEATYLVTNLMRSVLNEGTAAAVRSSFSLDAAGKTGTTNDLRDAWFAGFTPELLTVVWVGLDDNQPIGLSGSQAALPIWTNFMRRALAARPSIAFDAPAGVSFALVDKDTGKLATPNCPRTFNEAFLAGSAPHEYCDVHGGNSVLSKIGGLFRRIIR